LGDDLNLAIKFESIENLLWVPDDTYFNQIQSKRNSVTVFKGLKVPCFSKLRLRLKEDDISEFFDENSEFGYIDCDQIGAQEINF